MPPTAKFPHNVRIMTMTRKDFLGTLIKGTAVGAGAAMLLSACGGDDGDGGGTADAPPAGSPDASGAAGCSAGGATVTIGANHGHTLTVSMADVAAGTSRTYDIMGTSLHTHSVILTPAHFTMLAANQVVTVMSSDGSAHTHAITVRCA